MATINYSISFLRNDPSFVPIAADLYYTTDIGQEGFWRYDLGDSISADNTGIVIVTFNDSRLKRIFDGLINVKWFGAKGDAFPDNLTPTNDTANIQNAIDSMQRYYNSAYPNAVNQTVSESSGGLFFPAGFYLIDTISIKADNSSAQLKWKGETLRVNLVGSGMLSTLFVGNTSYFPSEVEPTASSYITTRNLIEVFNPYTNLKDFGIVGSPLIDGSYYHNMLDTTPYYYGPGYEFIGIYAEKCAFLNIERVFVRSCDTAINFKGVLTSNINNCIIGGENVWTNTSDPDPERHTFYDPNQACLNGIILDYDEGYDANQISIFESRIVWCRNWGLQYSKGSMLHIDNCTFEANGWYLTNSETTKYVPVDGDPGTGALRIYPRNSAQPPENPNLSLTDVINISKSWFEANLGYSIYCYYAIYDQLIFNLIGNTFIAANNKDTNINKLHFGVKIDLSPNLPSNSKTVNVIGCVSKIDKIKISITFHNTFKIICAEANIIGSDLFSPEIYPSTQTSLKINKI
jgi:hypothetical protein